MVGSERVEGEVNMPIGVTSGTWLSGFPEKNIWVHVRTCSLPI